MTPSQIISHLKQQIHQWQHQYKKRLNEQILTPFPPHLFSQNGERLGVYFDEIHLTIQRLESLPEDATQYASYLTERLIQQCAVLQENLSLWQSLKHPTHYRLDMDNEMSLVRPDFCDDFSHLGQDIQGK